MPVGVAVLASGNGSILGAIAEAGLPIRVVVVDRRCGAQDVAARFGLPLELIERTTYGPTFDRDAYTEQLVDVLERHQVALVAMAGFGTVLGKAIYDAYPERVLNTHPALLPDFKGWHAVRDALEAKVKVTGCTVHLATLEVDEGPILAQEVVPISRKDTEEELHERIKIVERRLYPSTIQTYMAYLEWLQSQWSSDPDNSSIETVKPRWVGNLDKSESSTMTTMQASPSVISAGQSPPAQSMESRPDSAPEVSHGRESSMPRAPYRRALLSVYDKNGLIELAEALSSMGIEIISSGGTSSALAQAGIAHQSVEQVTGAPEMLGGRVKTLNPKIHGGILADTSNPAHVEDLERAGITPIDLVVCNLYPFRSEPSIEMIDIGGPTMVRAAAKNHGRVGVVVDPADYQLVVRELADSGSLGAATRMHLARKAFAHTAAYDAAIVAWFDNSDPQSANRGFPETIHLTLQRAQDLRYGENPHQFGARYRNAEVPTWWDTLIQHSGMELSYLNLFDAEAAWRLVNEVGEAFGEEAPASVVIVKHANPCGVAISSDLSDAYQKAFDCDPISAFGGIVALSGTVTDDVAEVIVQCAQADVIIAPSYHPGALAKLIGKRKNTRILEAQSPSKVPIDLRRLDSGFLVQVPDSLQKGPDQWKAVTKVQPDASIMRDLELAWLVCARTSSNAIVIVKDGRAVGIGAGQQNRLDSARIAIGKAGDKVHGAAAASDAFFPFRDGLDALASSGVGAVIQPGGSVRDEEVIAAADEAGLAMVLTGERHFRH